MFSTREGKNFMVIIMLVNSFSKDFLGGENLITEMLV